MYLRYEVTTQCGVFGSHSESIKRNNIAYPLDLMDDGIRVGQVGFVSHSWSAGLPNHLIYLFLDLVLEWIQRSIKHLYAGHLYLFSFLLLLLVSYLNTHLGYEGF